MSAKKNDVETTYRTIKTRNLRYCESNKEWNGIDHAKFLFLLAVFKIFKLFRLL